MTDELFLDKNLHYDLCKVYAQTVLVDIHTVIHSREGGKVSIFRPVVEVDRSLADVESTIRAEHKG